MVTTLLVALLRIAHFLPYVVLTGLIVLVVWGWGGSWKRGLIAAGIGLAAVLSSPVSLFEAGLAFLAVLLTAPYWLFPIRAYVGTRFSARPRYERYDAQKHSAGPEGDALRTRQRAEVMACGFEVEAELVREDAESGVTTYMLILTSEGHPETGVFVHSRASRGTTVASAASLNFRTMFDGERQLVTSDDPTPETLPSPRGQTRHNLPSLRDAATLLRAHRMLVAARPATLGEPAARKTLGDDAERLVSERYHRIMMECVHTGFIRHDERRGVFRYTWQGACLATWYMLWPLRQRRARRALAAEARVLATLGIVPPPPSAEATSAPPAAPAGPASGDGNGRWRTAAGTVALLTILTCFPNLVSIQARGQDGDLFDGGRSLIRVPPGFSVPDSFPEAIRALEALAGRPSHVLMGTDANDRPMATDGVAIAASDADARAIVHGVQERFLARGFFLFRTDERAANGLTTSSVALVPTTDPYRIMHMMGTNASNYGKQTADVVAWFRSRERELPVRFVGIGFDYIEGRLPEGALVSTSIARQFLAFCPDLAEGVIPAAMVAREMTQARRVYCWWD